MGLQANKMARPTITRRYSRTSKGGPLSRSTICRLVLAVFFVAALTIQNRLIFQIKENEVQNNVTPAADLEKKPITFEAVGDDGSGSVSSADNEIEEKADTDDEGTEDGTGNALIDGSEDETNDAFDMTASESIEAEENAAKMKAFIMNYEKTCDESSTADDLVNKVKEHLINNDIEADNAKEVSSIARGVKRCQRTFIDFGANIGDSIGKFIDTSFMKCVKGRNTQPLFDVENHPEYFVSKSPNKAVKAFHNMIKSHNATASDYCLYAVEGNPVFTDRLKQLEEFVMTEMHTRPVQNLHVLTETVGTDTDGPTKLYLDTVNVKENYWGSSIHSSHQDVVKSENATKNINVAQVEGITLSTIAKQTLIAFSPDASDEEKKGGHLIVKVDIEGGEYQLISEVADSGIFCEYKKMGNQIDLIVEFHRMSITDPKVRNENFAKKRVMQDKLKQCGIEFKQLGANWA